MGHTRLGEIPKFKSWNEIVEIFSTYASEEELFSGKIIAEIAARTLDAAKGSLSEAINDKGFVYVYYLLTQLALAGKENNELKRLEALGIKLDEDSSIFDLISGINSSIDEYVDKYGGHTDVSEKAQKAASEAISIMFSKSPRSLFDIGKAEVLFELKKISTKKGFSSLSKEYLGNFLSRFLNFYLSRITARKLGKHGFSNIGDLSRFNSDFNHHCRQSANIVTDFSGDWYSKTEYLEGITVKNTKKFLAVAIKKLRSELELQKGE